MTLLETVVKLQEMELKATKADIFFQDEQETGECTQVSPGCYEGGIDGYEKTGEVFIVKDAEDKDAYPEEHARFENSDDADLYVALRESTKDILDVLRRFQKGDAKLLGDLIYIEEETAKFAAGFEEIAPEMQKIIDMLKRLQDAARKMEG